MLDTLRQPRRAAAVLTLFILLIAVTFSETNGCEGEGDNFLTILNFFARSEAQLRMACRENDVRPFTAFISCNI